MSSYQYELKNVYLGHILLPEEYQQVEYIQSSSTNSSWQWIDWQKIATWVTSTNNISIEVKISNFTQNWSFAVFGSDSSWWSNGYTLLSRSYEFGSNYTFDDWTASTRTICDWWTHIIELSQSWLIVDWTTKHTPSSVTFTWIELNLFAMNRAWTAREFWWFRMYYCKIWSSWTLVRDYVPCYRKSDNVIWLYDVVNKQFYVNSWSGSFTKWSNVE